jgi:hypothetical protein
MSNVPEFVSSHIKTLELRKNSNSPANAFATVAYSYEMESEFLRSFFPTRARRCHFCMGICYKSRDCDLVNEENSYVRQYFSSSTRGIGHVRTQVIVINWILFIGVKIVN